MRDALNAVAAGAVAAVAAERGLGAAAVVRGDCAAVVADGGVGVVADLRGAVVVGGGTCGARGGWGGRAPRPGCRAAPGRTGPFRSSWASSTGSEHLGRAGTVLLLRGD